jgi:hypothetical protein
MTNAVYTLALTFGVYVFFSIFYHNAIRPMLGDRSRFRIFALRDKLRRLAIEEEVDASSFEYQYLERLLCRLIDKCAWFSWTTLFEFLWRHADAKPSEDSIRFDAEASAATKEIYQQAISAMTLVMVTNSPIWTLTVVTAVCLGQMFGWAWKQWLEFKTKIFLEDPLASRELVLA